MEVKFTEIALEHFEYFNKINDSKLKNKIQQLLSSITKTPYQGIGKPEQLKYNYSGYWSRRINREHRLVYKYFEESKLIIVYSLKGHY
jgi:toxin YoeB